MHTTESKSRFGKVTFNFMLVAFLASGLLSSWMTFMYAQTTGPGNGQGGNSRPGELQRNPKPEPKTVGTPMEAARFAEEALSGGKGKIENMEDALKLPPQITVGEQPTLEAAKGLKPSGGGGQTDLVAGRQSAESHLHLVLRMTEGGGAEVLHATEVAGEAVISDEPVGTFVYEVTGSGQTLAVQAIPDPFEMRSFSGPSGTPTQGHHIERARTATVVVYVPKTNLVSAVESNLAVRVYKIKPGALIDKINPATLQKLKQENRLEIRIDLPASTLAPEIRQKGRKLGSQ
jgi:hypothetical protein